MIDFHLAQIRTHVLQPFRAEFAFLVEDGDRTAVEHRAFRGSGDGTAEQVDQRGLAVAGVGAGDGG